MSNWKDSVRHRGYADPPPSYESCVDQSAFAYPPAPTAMNVVLPSSPPLSHDEARQALMRIINKRWFISKSPAIEFEFVRMNHSKAYRYELATFTESRTTAWAHKPYTGQGVDGPEGGQEPDPWSMAVNPPGFFEDREEKLEVPHTASVEICHECKGVGKGQCWNCKGSGRVNCSSCNGSGRVAKTTSTEDSSVHQYVARVTCEACEGVGIRECGTCLKAGAVTCEVCVGAGRLKKYKELTISWKTNSVDRIIELTGLDHKCVREAQGSKLYEDERPRVTPLTDFPVPTMNLASQDLIPSQAKAFPEQKIHMQRQRVFFVPVHEVVGRWREKEFSFWVFGFDNSAHCPDYPGNCDCSCLLF